MIGKFSKLRLAALAGAACISSTTLANDPPDYRAVVLSWDPPTQNTDGTVLDDLQGFYVYVGTSPDSLYPMYYAPASDLNMVLTIWAPASRYFALSAVNVAGVESDLTPVVGGPYP